MDNKTTAPSDKEEDDITVRTVKDSHPPKLLVYCSPGSYECVFCETTKDNTMFLFTRKQIFVCSQCNKNLEAIMDTNKSGGYIDNTVDKHTR